MKKLLLIWLLLAAFCPGFAQPAERVYLATDRDWYAAGETIYLSAFCLDPSMRPSPLSGIAYVRLSSAGTQELYGKVALLDGRGAGSLALPRTLPSGNYRLSIYTALSPSFSRVISVYNTSSTARVDGGVRIGPAPDMPADACTGPILCESLPEGGLRLASSRNATVSVSLFRNQPLPSYGRSTMAEALAVPSNWPEDAGALPEYDGEIVTLRLIGVQSEDVFLSRPGHPGDVYYAPLQPDGTARFYTCNFFGEGDLAVILEKGAPAFEVQRVSPYRDEPAGEIPVLMLDATRADCLKALGARMQVTAAFDADTLYSRLPVREIPFASSESIRYILDDYTRFATMQEVFTEYLSDIRVRGKGESLEMQVRCREKLRGVLSFRSDLPSLIMVDGVPVMDHSLVYNLDPSLVKIVDIYPYSYVLGRVYSGVANFITFKGDMGGLRFGDNVRIIQNVSASYPVSFVPSDNPRYPSVRETLLWQPIVELQAGADVTFPCPDVPEGLVLVVEGIDEDGQPIYLRKVL